MSTKAVLFDLGNTLVRYYRGPEFRPILRRCLERAAELAGTVVTEDLYQRALALDREASSLEVRPLARRIRSLFPGVEEDRMPDMCRAFMEPIFGCARLDPNALGVLDALRSRGIGTAIVSNAPWGSPSELWRAELERHDLLRRVDVAVFCVDAGWRKPHPAPFSMALARLGVSPGEAMFVGDDPRWDVEGARRSRIVPVVLRKGGADHENYTVIRDLRDILDLVGDAD